jgi:capsular exopolysaccharide synthesis family protein
MDNTIKTDKDIENYLELPFLGSISKIKVKENEQYKKNKFVVYEPKSIPAESIKIVKSNIIFSTPKEQQKILLITSAGCGEGKTFISSNIAITFAQYGERTILIDCDLRRSTVHKIFEISNDIGLTNYLIGEHNIDDIIQRTDVEHLSVITAGHIPPNPAELLSQNRMKELLHWARERYEKIIIDSPPILPVSDTISLSKIADAVIIVVSHGKLPRQAIIRGKQILQDVGSKIIGVVLNNIVLKHRGYSSYYYYNYYGSYGYYSYYGSDTTKKSTHAR